MTANVQILLDALTEIADADPALFNHDPEAMRRHMEVTAVQALQTYGELERDRRELDAVIDRVMPADDAKAYDVVRLWHLNPPEEPLRLSGRFAEPDPEADMPPAAHGCWEPDDEPPVRTLTAPVVCALLLVMAALLGTMLWTTRPSACMAMGAPASLCVD